MSEKSNKSWQSVLKDAVKVLSDAFPERSSVIIRMIWSILAGENVLLLGPPGTAKSMLTRAVAMLFGGVYFETLLTKFSTPEEVFGPVSLRGLEQDKFQRVTTGKLPEAHFAFVDEVFKANSAILNSLLTAMNERVFHNGGIVKIPLITLFGASNELPEGKELEAMFDRFLCRIDVKYVLKGDSFKRIMTGSDPLKSLGSMPSLAPQDIDEMRAEIEQVDIPDSVLDEMMILRRKLQDDGIIVSDRRWRKCAGFLKVVAWYSDAKQVECEDLSELVDCLWREPSERSKVAAIVGNVADPISTASVELIDSARELVEPLAHADKASVVQTAQGIITKLAAMKRQAEVMVANTPRPKSKMAATEAVNEIEEMRKEVARRTKDALGL